MVGDGAKARVDKTGAMNRLEPNRLICGDAIEELRRMPSACASLIIADPPYNLGKDYGNNSDRREWKAYHDFTKVWLTEAIRVLKQDGSIYVFMGFRFIARLSLLLEDEFGLTFNSWITWHYTQGMGRKKGFSPRHEDILFFTKTRDFTFNLDAVRVPQKYFRERNNMEGANPGDVWQFSHVHYCSTERVAHPTQKPEALMDRIIRASSCPGELIIDPFVGSGTSCRVAQLLGREWIGIESNPDYIALAKSRLSDGTTELDSVDPRLSRTPRDLPSAEKTGQLNFSETRDVG